MSAEREAQFLAEVQSTLEDAVAAGVFECGSQTKKLAALRFGWLDGI